MKRSLQLIAAVLLYLLAAQASFAKDEIPTGVPTKLTVNLAADEAPPVGLQAAIGLAEEYAKREKIDLSKHYLFSARLIPKPDAVGKRAWEIIWDGNQKATDDELEFIVEMDKTVTRRPRG